MSGVTVSPVFDTGLTVTPLMGHLGCFASHWSVPVGKSPIAVLCVCIFISSILIHHTLSDSHLNLWKVGDK